MRRPLMAVLIFSICLWFILGTMAQHAISATTWTQQPGEFNWYKSGTANKYINFNSVDVSIPKTYVKQNDKVYIQCKSDGGSLKYYEQSLDCYGKPKVSIIAPPTDAISCADEGKSCAIPSGTKATVWYGTLDKWAAKENITGTIQCDNGSFGKDPAFGHNKKCFYKSSTTTPTPPVIVPNKCDAFMCESDFGITFDLTQNSVLVCPRVTITKEQLALIYDGIKAVGLPACK